MTLTTLRKAAVGAQRPAGGSTCVECQMGSHVYIPCGAPAKYIIRNRDVYQYPMCEMCAEHNVSNRGASIVKAGEKFALAPAVLTRNARKADEKLVKEVEEIEIEAPPPPSKDKLDRINALADTQKKLKVDLHALSEIMGKKGAALRVNQEVDLPEAMAAANMSAFSLMTGEKVAIKETVHASISKANQPLAFALLEDEGSGDIIKRQFVISFGKDELAWADKFERDMAKRKKPLKVEKKETVAPQTLAKLVRDRDKEMRPFPPEQEKLLGVFRKRIADVEVEIKSDDIPE